MQEGSQWAHYYLISVSQRVGVDIIMCWVMSLLYTSPSTISTAGNPHHCHLNHPKNNQSWLMATVYYSCWVCSFCYLLPFWASQGFLFFPSSAIEEHWYTFLIWTDSWHKCLSQCTPATYWEIIVFPACWGEPFIRASNDLFPERLGLIFHLLNLPMDPRAEKAISVLCNLSPQSISVLTNNKDDQKCFDTQEKIKVAACSTTCKNITIIQPHNRAKQCTALH